MLDINGKKKKCPIRWNGLHTQWNLLFVAMEVWVDMSTFG